MTPLFAGTPARVHPATCSPGLAQFSTLQLSADRGEAVKGSAGKINTELTILLSTVCASHSAAPPILEYAETRSSGRLQMSTNQNAHLKVQNTKKINLTIYIGYE